MKRLIPPVTLGGTVLLLVSIAACSSPSKPAPSPSRSTPASALRYIDAPALLVQCAISHGTLKAPDPDSGHSWLRGKKIVLDSGSEADFTSWYQHHAASVQIGGKTLASWAFWASDNDRLPAAVCGPNVSARKLQQQIKPADAHLWGS